MQKYVINNAKIWTADKNMPWAESITVNGNRIEAVGANGNAPEGYTVIDAEGKMIIPALMDSHTHVVSAAQTLWYLLLEHKEYESIDEIMEIVKAYADEHPKEEVPYIYAYSCPTPLMDADYADRYFMDKYISDRPVLLCDLNFHRALINSKMLELMEIDETVPFDPTTSANYMRYENSNVPNGFVEERAFEFRHDIDKMFDKLNWHPPQESDPEVLAPVLDAFNDFGVCGINDGFTPSEAALIGLKELEKQGRLHHYYNAMPLMSSVESLEETIETAKKWHDEYADEYIYIDCIKYFLDGTNELGTGAVIEPFINDPENYGLMNTTEDALTHVFERLNQENLGIQIHLVGDRSFRTSLNAVERAQKAELEKGREWRIRVTLLHCELTHPDDRKRAAELGVFINFTPVWAGGFFGEESKLFIGEERYKTMYSFNEIIESGAIVNFSSDIVDEEGLPIANPFLGMQIGHTRIDPLGDGTPREPLSECLSIEDLLTGYTINNALGMGIADKTGSLEKGKMANLLILSENIFDCAPDAISDIEAETIIFEGKVIKGEI